MIRKLLVALGVLAVAACLCFAIIAGLVIHYDHAAEQSARSFCASIQPGSDAMALIARAERERIRRTGLQDGAYDFLFPGWGDAGICHVDVANGKVAALHVRMQGD